ncbi:MAG: aminotransferase class IV [Solirubrobacterales bacterium]|nr:aminotransferase class IV [Solirubrobacterales bacterium]
MHSDHNPDPAQGVFTTLLVADGEPILLDAHLARLGASLTALYGAELPADAGRLVLERAAGIDMGRLRLSARPRAGGGLDLEVTATAIDPGIVLPPWEAGLELRSAACPGWSGAHKWSDRDRLEALERDSAPATPLLVDGAGNALETSRANVFAVVENTLVTAPADGSVLPGVMRARTLAIARDARLDVRERPLPLDELAAAGEAFATGAVRLLEPIRELDGRTLPGPGAVTALVGDALAALLPRARRPRAPARRPAR